jgi:hypothetical protein
MRLRFTTRKYGFDGSVFKKARTSAIRLQDKLDFEK